MSKKRKNKKTSSKKRNTRSNTRPNISKAEAQQASREQEKKNLKTLATGAVILGFVMIFFALKIDGQTLFQKMTSSDDGTQTSSPSQP